MRTGGGGRGSHAVRQAPHPHNIEMHQLPTKKRAVDDVQHAPLCSHTPHSTSTNTNRYTHCCAGGMRTGGGGRGAHAVRQATHTPKQMRFKKNCPPKHGCRRAACAPVLTHAPLHLDKDKQIHTLLRSRYDGEGRRAWGTRGATSHSHTCYQKKIL